MFNIQNFILITKKLNKVLISNENENFFIISIFGKMLLFYANTYYDLLPYE